MSEDDVVNDKHGEDNGREDDGSEDGVGEDDGSYNEHYRNTFDNEVVDLNGRDDDNDADISE